MSNFTEYKLEQAFCELLAQEGYPHSLGITLPRQTDDVLIETETGRPIITNHNN